MSKLYCSAFRVGCAGRRVLLLWRLLLAPPPLASLGIHVDRTDVHGIEQEVHSLKRLSVTCHQKDCQLHVTKILSVIEQLETTKTTNYI